MGLPALDERHPIIIHVEIASEKVNCRCFGGFGLCQKFQVGLLECPAAFFVITGWAGGHKIFPCVSPPKMFGLDMVDG